jgi:hypothetical protein
LIKKFLKDTFFESKETGDGNNRHLEIILKLMYRPLNQKKRLDIEVQTFVAMFAKIIAVQKNH